MRLEFRRHDLRLRHAWAIASDAQGGAVRAKAVHPVVFVSLDDGRGRRGLGEASPSRQYAEDWETCLDFLRRVDPRRLSFDDVPGSMSYLGSLQPGRYPAKCALNLALLDGAATAAGRPLGEFLGLPPVLPGRHETSFTIGLDTPAMIGRKVAEASAYGVLKVKVGVPSDAENLAALRRVAPTTRIRVDANAAWRTREEALARIEALAQDGRVEFVEQPMPAGTPTSDLAWLRERSPLPLVGDESYQSAADAGKCAAAFHGVNVKLVKTGGVTAAKEALEAARAQGLRTMLGCMIESSVLISAAAHLAPLADWLDLDGNLLVDNDPYAGVRDEGGWLTFEHAPLPHGLRVAPVAEASE